MERDVERFGERVLDDPPRRSSGTWGGWTREWNFLIWTWTLNSDSEDCFVETVQHRFLGEEEIHRYSRWLWKLGAFGCLVIVPVVLSFYGVMIYMAVSDPDVYGKSVAVLGLVLLPAVAAAAAIVYFTFVPPKEYRSSRRG